MTANCGHWIIDIEFNPDDFWGFIYEIEEIATGRSYIGKKQFRFKRKKTKSNKSKTKESDWREYTSSCIPLQEAIETQGKDKFVFRMLSLCSGRCQLTYEENQLQFTRDVLRAKLPNGERKYWNKTIGHLLFAGVEKQTEEAKAKMSAARLGKCRAPFTEEHKRKLSMSKRGKIHTKETKLKMSARQKGRPRGPHTEETKIILSAILVGNTRCLGYLHSEETKRKMSIARMNYLANRPT